MTCLPVWLCFRPVPTTCILRTIERRLRTPLKLDIHGWQCYYLEGCIETTAISVFVGVEESARTQGLVATSAAQIRGLFLQPWSREIRSCTESPDSSIVLSADHTLVN